MARHQATKCQPQDQQTQVFHRLLLSCRRNGAGAPVNCEAPLCRATATCMPALPAAPAPASCAGATAGVCWYWRRPAAGAAPCGREDMTFDPVGVWDSERVFGPELRGGLTLRRAGAQWRAQLGEAEAVAPVAEEPLLL